VGWRWDVTQTKTFKDEHPEMQQLVQEFVMLRRWNKEQEAQKNFAGLFLFAEGALILLIFERCLRIILGSRVGDSDTLPNLLEKVTTKAAPILKFEGLGRQDAIKEIKDVRNGIMHANYEQAARRVGAASVQEYLQKHFAPEIENLAEIVDGVLKQIDVITGNPW
jgi:hypothetical protein